MNLIDALQIVRGAVAEKDLVPVLTHFFISDGRIQGANGRVAIESHCDFQCDSITVPGAKFLKAMDLCGEDYMLEVQDNNIEITAGSTSVVLPLSTTPFPVVETVKRFRRLDVKMLETFRRLLPFIAKDASRPQLCAIAIREHYAYAANNPVIARIPIDLPNMVIPVFMINELLRIGIEPVGYNSTNLALTFKLSNAVWIQSTLLTGEWPDVEKFFDKRKMPLIPRAEMIAAVEAVLPFCADEKFPIVQLSDAGITTGAGQMSAAVADLHLPESKWNASVLLTVLQEATHFKLDDWPEACRWKGDGIEGVAIGVR